MFLSLLTWFSHTVSHSQTICCCIKLNKRVYIFSYIRLEVTLVGNHYTNHYMFTINDMPASERTKAETYFLFMKWVDLCSFYITLLSNHLSVTKLWAKTQTGREPLQSFQQSQPEDKRSRIQLSFVVSSREQSP